MKKQLLRAGLALSSIFILAMLMLNSCKKDTGDYIEPGTQWSNTETVTASFLGQVVKEDGSPLDGATVTIGTHMMTTDADGFYYFTNILTPQKATLIEVEKAGYFKAYRTMSVMANQDNQTRIMTMALPAPVNLDGAQGGQITISNGGSIDFPQNAIINPATNAPYTGNVAVFAKWIDPSGSNLDLLIPGALRGISEDGVEEDLTTYGMQAVELIGAAGEKLQLAPGKKATITFPLPASLAGSAPVNVPLWHFDEAQGMWVEEGFAVRSGNDYVGAVSHFSFWNCDYGGPIVNFTCQLVDTANNPISGAIVKIVPTSSTTLTARSAMTNSNGMVSGGLPVNATFSLEYIPAGCPWNAASTFLQSFSSTTTNVNLGTITVSNATTAPSIVTGTVQDCNSNILANAPVKLKVGSMILSTLSDASGAFSFSVSCISSTTAATLTAYDATNSVNGSSNINLNPGATTNAGVVAACGTQNDFITILVTNPPATTPTTYSIVEPAGTFSQYYQLNTGISGSDNSSPANPLYISFEFDGPQTAAGVHNLLNYYDSNDSIGTITPATVNLTNYGPVGGKISGSFTTTVTGLIYNAATVNCTFRVTRQM